MKRFELFEHTADIGLRAYGNSLQDVFANTASGMFSILIETENIVEEEYVEIVVNGYDLKELLVNFLSELLYLYNVKEFIASRVEIKDVNETSIRAKAFGQIYIPERHEILREIKSVTYHQLKVEQRNGIWHTQIIFDV